jgi:hypothetical protein
MDGMDKVDGVDRIGVARRQLRAIGESGIGMSCGGCGHFDDLGRFTSTAVFGELPQNEFQCPRCGWAVERRMGVATVRPSGFVMPGAVALVPVGARL